jgi:hypothetical protein
MELRGGVLGERERRGMDDFRRRWCCWFCCCNKAILSVVVLWLSLLGDEVVEGEAVLTTGGPLVHSSIRSDRQMSIAAAMATTDIARNVNINVWKAS